MFSKFRKYIFWLSIVNTIGILVIAYFFALKPNQAYIDNVSVFQEFTLTKELEKQKNDIEMKRIQVLVRLENDLDEVKSKLSETPNNKDLQYKFSRLNEEINTIIQKFDEQNLELKNKYDNEIWTKLNQYIKEYGEKNKLKIIFGVSGQGNIMYAKEGIDKTEEIIKYVNERYKGLEK